MGYSTVALIMIVLAIPAQYAISQVPIGQSFAMGITAFWLTHFTDTQGVEGFMNITQLSIGEDLFPNGSVIGSGNVSLQLNAMVDGKFWAQDVLLIHEDNRSYFTVYPILNLWNLSGPFYGKWEGNVTTFGGFGVVCYQGRPFNITLPYHLGLRMEVSQGVLEFKYLGEGGWITYAEEPLTGSFSLGGLSVAGLPNDLELVWGGPGGGSLADLTVNGTETVYYYSGGHYLLPSQVISVGLDTGESVIGVKSYSVIPSPLNPRAYVGPGTDDPVVLWPVPPNVSETQRNSSVELTVTLQGKPLAGQRLLLEDLVSSSGFLSKVNETVTNSSGQAVFHVNPDSLYLVYYPGNFSVSSFYVPASPAAASAISTISSELHTTYQDLVNYVKGFNFHQGIKSVLGLKYHSTNNNPNYYFLELFAGLGIGIFLAAVVTRFKRDL